MARWSEKLAGEGLALHALALAGVLGCGESHGNDAGGDHGARGGAAGGLNGGASGTATMVAGAGLGTNGGAGNAGGGRAGAGGSPVAGGGGRGGSSGGQAGQGDRGGMGGDANGVGGDGSALGGEGGSPSMGGSGGTPGGTCRRYATEFSVTSSSGVTMVSCEFERASLTQTCTTDEGDVTKTVWTTIDDAVAENDPLGLHLEDRIEQYIAFPTAPCRLTQDFQYDGEGRNTAIVVTIDPEMTCGTNQITYDAWDPDGRPTHGIEQGVGGELCVDGDVTVTYDDLARTVTTTRSGGTDCLDMMSVLSFDENGFRTTSSAGTNLTSTYATLATGEICK